MKIFERRAEIEWLNKFSAWNRLLTVIGPKGVGKSTILRHWVGSQKIHARWFTCNHFLSLASLLGNAELSLEAALEHASPSWSDLDVVVWDDVHLLPQAARLTLFIFLKNLPTTCLHLIVSDESLLEEHGPEVPELFVSPLTEEEVERYLIELTGYDKKISATEVLRATGGLPLFINLYLHKPSEISFLQKGLLESLSPHARRFLLLASTLKGTLARAEACSCLGQNDLSAAIHELEKRLLLGSDFQNSDTFSVAPHVRDIALASLNKQESRALDLEALKIRMARDKADPFEIFIQALQAGELDIARDRIGGFKLTRLEPLSQSELQVLSKWLEEYCAKIDWAGTLAVPMAAEYRFARLLIHALILQGRREEALNACRKLKELLPPERLPDPEAQWLAYDIIHWMNRSNLTEETKELLNHVLARSQAPMLYFFQIEQAKPYVDTIPARAIEVLKRLLQACDKIANPSETEILIKAQAQFQFARALQLELTFITSPSATGGFSGSHNLKEAARLFAMAEENYKLIDRPYFGAISGLNRAWIALELRDFVLLQELLGGLKAKAKKFGYRYLIGGIDLIAATIDRLSGANGQAFERVEAVFESLKTIAPRQAQIDSLKEKARILAALGLVEKSAAVVEQIASVTSDKRFVDILRLECGIDDLNFEELCDRWNQTGEADTNESFWISLLERGHEPSVPGYREQLQRCAIGRLALAQFELLTRIRSGQKELVWQSIGQIEQLLAAMGAGEPKVERVALLCLQAQLAGSTREASANGKALLERASIELKRWGCDNLLKSPFEAWIDFLSSRDSKAIADDPRWSKARVLDQERWGLWIGERAKSNLYLMETAEGKTEVSEIPRDFSMYSIVLLEHLGQVTFHGTELVEFHRKTVLRQILALLFEVFPSGLAKATIATTIWGETYSPEVHDPRIYMNIKRLRALFGAEAIESWNGAYRWNSRYTFAYVKSLEAKSLGQSKLQVLLVQALKNYQASGKIWASRSELVEATGSSEATVKRALSRLVSDGTIVRKGAGPSVVYSLERENA